ncbi:MAG: hypothetical protein AAGA66_11775 [Bacteroidota bacterium]
MKRIKVGDLVASDYGKGEVLAITDQWLIHNNSLNNRNDEFAILIADESVRLLEKEAIQ